jgi:hypothetical protein
MGSEFLKIDFVKEAINSCFFPWLDGLVAIGLLVVKVSISPSSITHHAQ